MCLNKQIKSKQQMLVLTLLVVIFVLSGSCSKNKPKMHRIGILFPAEGIANIIDNFKERMAELGYVAGENIIYDFPHISEMGSMHTIVKSQETLKALDKFVDDKVDLILAFPTDLALAAKEATQGTDIPIVFVIGTIEGNNLVDDIHQPGGHITGVRDVGPDMTVRRLEILHELIPDAKRVWITHNPDSHITSSIIRLLHEIAPSMNITLVEATVTSVEEVKADLEARFASDDVEIDAIMLLPNFYSLSLESLRVISSFAVEHKVPVAGIIHSTEDRGILFGYNVDNSDVAKIAAYMADKILGGTQAGSIPVATAKAHLWINYKRAQELGLTVPEGLLSQADEIIR